MLDLEILKLMHRKLSFIILHNLCTCKCMADVLFLLKVLFQAKGYVFINRLVALFNDCSHANSVQFSKMMNGFCTCVKCVKLLAVCFA